jgi:iron complex outermembrane receptor protein
MELIAEHSLAGAVRLTGSVFTNRITQLINQDQNPDGTLSFRNLGNVTAKGFESQVEATWRDDYQARLSYTFQQTRDELTAGTLSNSPRHLAKLNLIAPLKRGRLFAGLEAQYIAGRSTEEDERVPGFTVVNLTAFAPRVARHLDFSLSVFNVFNRRYVASESDPTIAPVIQDGRTARVKLTYRF